MVVPLLLLLLLLGCAVWSMLWGPDSEIVLHPSCRRPGKVFRWFLSQLPLSEVLSGISVALLCEKISFKHWTKIFSNCLTPNSNYYLLPDCHSVLVSLVSCKALRRIWATEDRRVWSPRYQISICCLHIFPAQLIFSIQGSSICPSVLTLSLCLIF